VGKPEFSLVKFTHSLICANSDAEKKRNKKTVLIKNYTTIKVRQSFQKIQF